MRVCTSPFPSKPGMAGTTSQRWVQIKLWQKLDGQWMQRHICKVEDECHIFIYLWQATVGVNNDKAKPAKISEKEQTQTQLQHNYEQQCIIYYDYSLFKPYKHMKRFWKCFFLSQKCLVRHCYSTFLFFWLCVGPAEVGLSAFRQWNESSSPIFFYMHWTKKGTTSQYLVDMKFLFFVFCFCWFLV